MQASTRDSKLRFSGRVGAYAKYRPGYPPGVTELYRRELGLTPATVVADVGSGTGISAEVLLRNGNTVYCVEPNPDMRAAAEQALAKHPGFRSVEGAGEATTLADASIDLVICAQAFHWLDHAGAAAEFKRVARPGGHVAVLWNDRKTDASPFLAAYDALLLRYGTDYARVAHEKSPASVEWFTKLFGVPFKRAAFANEQRFDLEGLRGRVASSSYTPAPGQPGYAELYAALDELFARHAREGAVTFEYDTAVYYARLA
jgi:SAM-dependent methyltransferase